MLELYSALFVVLKIELRALNMIGKLQLSYIPSPQRLIIFYLRGGQRNLKWIYSTEVKVSARLVLT